MLLITQVSPTQCWILNMNTRWQDLLGFTWEDAYPRNLTPTPLFFFFYIWQNWGLEKWGFAQHHIALTSQCLLFFQPYWSPSFTISYIYLKHQMLFIFGEIRKITSKCEASFPDVFNSRRFHKPDNIQAKHKLWALGKGLSSLPWVIRQQALQMEGGESRNS